MNNVISKLSNVIMDTNVIIIQSNNVSRPNHFKTMEVIPDSQNRR